MADAHTGTYTQCQTFWDFSLRFYALQGVAPSCLAMQDKASVDVNLMLFLLFLADRGRTVTTEEIGRLDTAIRAWRANVVEPLRALRRRLKTGIDGVAIESSEPLRTLVKKAELESERVEQTVLEGLEGSIGRPGMARADAAAHNIQCLEAFIGPLPRQAVQILLSAFTNGLPLPA